MKVAILTEASMWGGLEVHSIGLAEALAAVGHRPSIICLGDRAYGLYRPRVSHNIELVDLGPPQRRTAWQWWRSLRKLDMDAVVLEKATLWTGSLALDVLLRLRCARYIAVQHAPPPELPPRTSQRHLAGLLPGVGLWWHRWKWSGYLRSLGPHVTVCVSDFVREQLASVYGFSQRRLMTIPNGVDARRFAPDNDTRRLVRAKWGVPDGAFVFGSVGRFTHDKGLDLALLGLARMIQDGAGRAVYLVLVGEGALRDHLQNLARQLHVDDHLIMPGFLENPAEAYRGFDVFVLPSRVEALSLSLIEALASGCEVIATQVGGIPEVVSTPELGKLVPPEDPDALADAMRRALVGTDDERAARGRAARQHVLSRFNAQDQCRETIRLLT